MISPNKQDTNLWKLAEDYGVNIESIIGVGTTVYIRVCDATGIAQAENLIN